MEVVDVLIDSKWFKSMSNIKKCCLIVGLRKVLRMIFIDKSDGRVHDYGVSHHPSRLW